LKLTKETQMKIFFGAVDYDPSELDADELFTTSEAPTKYFYYQLEWGTNNGGMEDVMLRDTCDREVPVSIDHINELIDALVRVRDMNDDIKRGKELEEKVEGDSEEVIGDCW